MKRVVPGEERALLKDGQHDQVERFKTFDLYRRSNEIVLLSHSEPHKDVSYNFQSATTAKTYFNQAVKRRLMVEIPVAEE